jgi:ProP effector
MAIEAEADATIAELAMAFPAAFSLDPIQVRPLKAGIRDDLYAQSAISHTRIKAALAQYCNSKSYLEVSTEDATRIDLAGNPAGNVTAKEAEAAKRRISRIVSGTVEKRTAQPDLEASKPGPKRLGLGDLKKAAAARKGI